MFNGFDLSTIYDAKYGSTQVNEIYCGSTKIWPNHDYSRDYLTLYFLESGELSLMGEGGGYEGEHVHYSLDNGASWSTLWFLSDFGTDRLNISAGDVILFKNNVLDDTLNTFIGFSEYCPKYNVYGNIMSMTYGDNFIGQTDLSSICCKVNFRTAVNANNLILPATTLHAGCYEWMFDRCSNLITAPELPATTLTYYCYAYMFRGCTSLITAPELPATTLNDNCYDSMFRGCTSLITAPELPATNLNNPWGRWCYANMFYGCTSLTTAPELPATRLNMGSYANMFKGCTSLNYIKCLATDISATNCTDDWVYNVNANGDFYKDANTTWPSGDDGIPAGWNVHNL